MQLHARRYADQRVSAGPCQVQSVACSSPRGLQALSAAGRCRTLDAAADGYGRGEGFVVAALAPLGTAARPLGLLAGSAVNQDGRSSSLTAPNGPAQRSLVATTLSAAGAGADDVGYVVLHGTGKPQAAGLAACCAVALSDV